MNIASLCNTVLYTDGVIAYNFFNILLSWDNNEIE